MYNRTRKIVMSAMLAALVCVATMIIKIQLTPNGYINLGDGIVIISGYALGPLYGFLAAGIGSALADLFSGFVLYMPATFIVKGFMAVLSYTMIKWLSSFMNKTIAVIISAALAEALMIIGYYIFEGFIYGFQAALLSMPGNAIQSVAGIVTGTLLVKMYQRCRY